MTKPPNAMEERGEGDGRLFSPSAGRNKSHIAAALSELLPKAASVLEIGSGTGEHGISTLARRPDLRWQFSDPDETSRQSQAAWIKYAELDQNAPLLLDMTDAQSLLTLPDLYDGLFCANMVHIAPIEALYGLAELSERLVRKGGQVCLYGPFLFGTDSAPSNLEFDRSLKRRNPDWGVRELAFVKHIFAKHGFNACTLREMPSHNFLLGFSRD